MFEVKIVPVLFGLKFFEVFKDGVLIRRCWTQAEADWEIQDQGPKEPEPSKELLV